ncbi:hypothetical protein FXO38_27196 [Capsicum annuum]|nr:hypothetical protein FXO38_27196 [Capsicum annuum]
MVLNEKVTKLLLVLIDMLVHIGDGPCWGDAANDDGNRGELSMCIYGKESLGRLAITLGGSVIVPNLPSTIFNFLDHEDWQIHYSVVTAIGVISEGCSKVIVICSKDMKDLVESIVKLIFDNHPQSGMTIMNEAALATLGFLAIQSQLLLVIQVKNSMPNTWERITMITMEVGNLAIVDLVAKVNTISILPSPSRGLHALKYFIILGHCRTRFAARNSYGGRRSNEVPFVTIKVETRSSLKELYEQIVYIDDEFMCFLLYRVIPLATVIKALVEIGDKDPSFIGSSEWIGSIELSFVLDKLIGVSCKIINVRSGAELPEKCRKSALHFENQGTPVIIGRSYCYCNMLLAMKPNYSWIYQRNNDNRMGEAKNEDADDEL